MVSKKTTVKIIAVGKVQVSSTTATILYKSKKCVILSYDIDSKYSIVGYISNRDNDGFVIALDANENTLYTNDTDDFTYLSFPEFSNLRIFMAEASRYSLIVTLFNPN